MLSEGSSVKGSPEDKQLSGPYIKGTAWNQKSGRYASWNTFLLPVRLM